MKPVLGFRPIDSISYVGKIQGGQPITSRLCTLDAISTATLSTMKIIERKKNISDDGEMIEGIENVG